MAVFDYQRNLLIVNRMCDIISSPIELSSWPSVQGDHTAGYLLHIHSPRVCRDAGLLPCQSHECVSTTHWCCVACCCDTGEGDSAAASSSDTATAAAASTAAAAAATAAAAQPPAPFTPWGENGGSSTSKRGKSSKIKHGRPQVSIS
jgi:hypothetical protein